MSKSTPISQLPSSDNSIQGDIIEDDATVQEVLSQISQSSPELMITHTDAYDIMQPQSPAYQPASSSQNNIQLQHQQQQQMQQHQQQYLAQQMSQHAQQLPGPGSAQQPINPQAQPFYFQMPFQPSHTALSTSTATEENMSAASPSDSIANEIRMIILVIIVAIIIQIIPVHSLVNRIKFLENIPYSPIFVKAIIAGGLFFAIRKYIS
jgi:hypothetical protein